MAITNELRETIKLMQNGNEEAFGNFYQATYSYVYGKARYIMHDEEDALDLTQETFIQAYHGIGGIADVDSVYAWLGGIVYRQGMKIFNKKKELLTSEEQEYVFEEIVSEDATPEQVVEMQATANIVQDMIEELPELQRVAVMAFYYDDMKIDDIASMCDCSSNTIKSRLNYAKKFLKEKVEAHQKKNQYKLCSVSPVLLLLAFKNMFGKVYYQMPSKNVDSVYASICGKLGIKAVALSATEGTAVTGATVAAASTGLGIKIAAIASAVLLAGTGIGFGSYGLIKHLSEDENVSVNSTEDLIFGSETGTKDLLIGTATDETTSDKDTPVETTSEEETTEEADEELPVGKQTEYVSSFSNLQFNVSNVKQFYDAGKGSLDLQIVKYNDDGTKEDSVFEKEVQFLNGKASIDMLSKNGNRYFGDIYRFDDGSMMAFISINESGLGTYDLGNTYYVPVFMLKEKLDEVQDVPFTPTSYQGRGCDIEIISMDGEYMNAIIGIRTIDANTFKGRTDDNDQLVSYNGIVTFNMTTTAGTTLRGYMYKNREGKLLFNYLEFVGDTLRSHSPNAYQLVER